jgi:hypothetical protein
MLAYKIKLPGGVLEKDELIISILAARVSISIQLNFTRSETSVIQERNGCLRRENEVSYTMSTKYLINSLLRDTIGYIPCPIAGQVVKQPHQRLVIFGNVPLDPEVAAVQQRDKLPPIPPGDHTNPLMVLLHPREVMPLPGDNRIMPLPKERLHHLIILLPNRRLTILLGDHKLTRLQDLHRRIHGQTHHPNLHHVQIQFHLDHLHVIPHLLLMHF